MVRDGIINNYLILDVETTIFQHGHPFAECNKLCLVGLKTTEGVQLFDIEYTEHPCAKEIAAIQAAIDACDTIVLFNGKFDLHWLARYGIRFNHKLVWDCQLVEFILSNQLIRFPSLDGTAARLGLEYRKTDAVKTEYWEKGLDTTQIPASILYPYLEQDLLVTEAVYLRQLEDSKDRLPLIKAHNADLLVLQEMEQNGILFNWSEMHLQARALRERNECVLRELDVFSDGFEHFNWASGDHLSSLLYGGQVNVKVGEPYEHTYQSGAKAGKTETRYKWHVVSRTYPRLCEPLEGSELKKPGYWATDEGTLRRLKGNKKLINLLLERAELEKLLSTYYEGIPKLLEEMDWKDNIVHGKFNQCVAVTGRLSAEKPNQQNFVAELMKYIISRFDSRIK